MYMFGQWVRQALVIFWVHFIMQLELPAAAIRSMYMYVVSKLHDYNHFQTALHRRRLVREVGVTC